MSDSHADSHINDLIATLCTRASSIGCKADERQMFIDQIAQLRASMNVPVISTQEILDRR